MTIDTILAKFGTTKFISKLDLRSGYWQIPLEKESMDICSFLINGRNYSFRQNIEVLTRFRRHHVTVNVDKCQFFRKEVSFLGHIISSEKIKMDAEKIKTIQEFKTPNMIIIN